MRLGPRVVIAGTHSGVGKTTVATGLMAALRARGMRVASAKVGPDYIDPGYHRVATGRAGASLDVWLNGVDLVGPAAAAAAQGAELLVVEGVMGLFDGSGEPTVDGSTAEVARILKAPVILVVDASAMSGSVAALVHGFATFDRQVHLAGIVLNKVGGAGHAALLAEALEPVGVPVVGWLATEPSLEWRERHLGLVPIAEHWHAVAASVARLSARIEAQLDIDVVLGLARRAPVVAVDPLPNARPVGSARIAVAAGPAFSFVYPENLALLAQAGGQLVEFDPAVDRQLPERVTALYVGGGFPETYASELADNRPLIADVRAAVDGGVAVWAECGGLLWLSRSLDGKPLVGNVPADAHMTDSLTIGYRTATTTVTTPFGPPGTELRGHEFHRSAVDPPGDALVLQSRFGSGHGGYADRRLLASYLHQHLASRPDLAERFVATAAAVMAV